MGVGGGHFTFQLYFGSTRPPARKIKKISRADTLEVSVPVSRSVSVPVSRSVSVPVSRSVGTKRGSQAAGVGAGPAWPRPLLGGSTNLGAVLHWLYAAYRSELTVPRVTVTVVSRGSSWHCGGTARGRAGDRSRRRLFRKKVENPTLQSTPGGCTAGHQPAPSSGQACAAELSRRCWNPPSGAHGRPPSKDAAVLTPSS